MTISIDALVILGLTGFATSVLSGMIGMAGGVTLLAVMLLFLPPLVAIPLHGLIHSLPITFHHLPSPAAHLRHDASYRRSQPRLAHEAPRPPPHRNDVRYAKVTPQHLRDEYLKAIEVLENQTLVTQKNTPTNLNGYFAPADIIAQLIKFRIANLYSIL